MDYLSETQHGNIIHLRMEQGAKLNALSDGMLAALQTRLDELATQDELKVIILSGAGKVFCAGHDLREMQAARAADDQGAAMFADLFSRCAKLMQTIRQQPQVVIAQVHGIATAAGCQLAATCDMVVADENARFGVNGVNIGLFCSTPMVALTRAIGQKAAFDLLTTGRFVYAEEAKAMGLITRISPTGQLAEDTMALAQTVAGKLGAALRLGKGVFYAQSEHSEAAAYDLAAAAMVENMLNPDTDEGLTAFLDKRAPSWSEED